MTDILCTVLKTLKTWKFWKELLIMTLAMTVASAGVYYFLVPSKLVIGSISGLAIVLSGILANMGVAVKVSNLVLVINAVLLVFAYLLIGKEFGLKTVYTALILGPLMNLWEAVLPYETLLGEGQTSVMGDLWFDLLCFVLILSISQAILFRINASTGGLDIIAKIVNKYLHFDIGTSVTVAGALICCSAFAINPFRLVVIGLVGTWINDVAVDYFMSGLNRRKKVCIITANYEEIRSYIVDELNRGCTLYDVKGGYGGESRVEIETIIPTNDFSSLMDFIKRNGYDCFITAGSASEVYGKWNDTRKRKG